MFFSFLLPDLWPFTVLEGAGLFASGCPVDSGDQPLCLFLGGPAFVFEPFEKERKVNQICASRSHLCTRSKSFNSRGRYHCLHCLFSQHGFNFILQHLVQPADGARHLVLYADRCYQGSHLWHKQTITSDDLFFVLNVSRIKHGNIIVKSFITLFFIFDISFLLYCCDTAEFATWGG